MNKIENSPTSYSVNLWGSLPEEENDDCWTGADYATLAEAQTAVTALAVEFPHQDLSYIAFIEIDGPDHYSVIPNPKFDKKHRDRERAQDDAEWKRERAMQAGMAFGCDGYNDEMGF